MKIALLAAAAALTLAGCSAADLDDAVERARSTETVTATQTAEAAPVTETITATPLPDDRVVPSTASAGRVVDPTNGDVLTDQEVRFLGATCELLDDGFTIGELMVANLELDLPFADGRMGELMALAVIIECPRHSAQMDEFLTEMGY